MECLRKIFEIVVQSRVHFQPERGAKNTTPQRPRVRAELTLRAIAKRCVVSLLTPAPAPSLIGAVFTSPRCSLTFTSTKFNSSATL